MLGNGQLVSGNISGSFDGLFIVPTYTLGSTILSACPGFSMAFIPAYNAVSGNVHFCPLSAFRSDPVFWWQRSLSDSAVILERICVNISWPI